MSFNLWITYFFATTVILIIPGPTIILVISQAVAHGRKSVVPLAAGVVLGDFTAMTLSLLGLGAIMSASAALFTMFTWIGAIYLLYLGIKKDVEFKSSIKRGAMRDHIQNSRKQDRYSSLRLIIIVIFLLALAYLILMR